MTSEVLDFIKAVGVSGFIIVIFGIIVYTYSRVDAARRASKNEQKSKDAELDRRIQAANLQTANSLRQELSQVYQDSLRSSQQRESQLTEKVGRLENRLESLENQADDCQLALDNALAQNQRCQEALAQVTQERDTFKRENDDLRKRVTDVENIQTDLRKQIDDLVSERQKQDTKIAGQSETIARLEKQLTSVGHGNIGE